MPSHAARFAASGRAGVVRVWQGRAVPAPLTRAGSPRTAATSRGRHCPRRVTISGRCVASRAARPAPKGCKDGPQRRGDKNGAGNVLSSSQRLLPTGDGRHGACPLLPWRRCDGHAGTARATGSTCQGQAADQASTSPPFPWSPLFLNCQWGRRAAHILRLDQKSRTKRNLTAISGRCVAPRAARPAQKGRKGGPQRRGDEEGVGNVLALSRRPRRLGDGRSCSPGLGWSPIPTVSASPALSVGKKSRL